MTRSVWMLSTNVFKGARFALDNMSLYGGLVVVVSLWMCVMVKHIPFWIFFEICKCAGVWSAEDRDDHTQPLVEATGSGSGTGGLVT